MAHGHNTDVVFDGTTYHVQTEDRGEQSVHDTLVYCGGQILHRERGPYAEVAGDPDEVQHRLDRQHRDIVRRARHGEFFRDSRVSLADRVPEDRSLDEVVLEALPAFVPGVLRLGFEDGRITVRRDADGEPVPGARVVARVVRAGAAPVGAWTGETGPDGCAEVPGLPDRGVVVFAADAGGMPGRLRVELSGLNVECEDDELEHTAVQV